MLPQRLRRPAAGVAGLALVLLVILAVRYHDSQGYGRLDNWAASLASGLAHAQWLGLIVWLGTASFVVPAAGALGAALLAARRWRLAALAIMGPGVTGAVTTLMKPVVGRTFQGGLALPSGHTGGLTAVSLVVGLLFFDGTAQSMARRAVVIAAAVTSVASAMAVSLVGLRIHYATDTVAGFCVAVTVCLAAAAVIDGTASSCWAQSAASRVRAWAVAGIVRPGAESGVVEVRFAPLER